MNELWKVWLVENSNVSWVCVIEAIDIISMTHLLQKIYINERNIDKFEIWTSHQPEHFANISIICHKERRATINQEEDVAKAIHSGKLNIRRFSSTLIR